MGTTSSFVASCGACGCLVFVLAACGSVVSPGDGGGGGDSQSTGDAIATESGSLEAGSADVSMGGSDSSTTPSTAVTCTSHPEVTYPASATACRDASECATTVHGIDCCGTRQIVGVNRAAQAAFDAAEAQCRAAVHFDMCDCAARPTTAQDGRTVDPSVGAAVECRAGNCFTLVR